MIRSAIRARLRALQALAIVAPVLSVAAVACTVEAPAEDPGEGTAAITNCSRLGAAACVASLDCQLQGTRCVSLDCTKLTKPQCLTSGPKCAWQGGRCVPDCSSLKKPDCLLATEKCVWSDNACVWVGAVDAGADTGTPDAAPRDGGDGGAPDASGGDGGDSGPRDAGADAVPTDARADATPVDAGPSCGPSQKVCSAACVEQSDPTFGCGATGCSACSLPNTAKSQCQARACGVATCSDGFGNCDGRADTGCETDITSSMDHCGGCNVPCRAPANGTASCKARTCTTSCNDGFNRCGSACLPDSPTTCGASCVSCPVPAHGAAACVSGGCDVVCNQAPYTRRCAAGCCLPKPTIVDVVAGDGFTCALTNTGGVKCWGFNGQGQLGVTGARQPTPVDALAAGTSVTAFAASFVHVCAASAGAVRCWGKNTGLSHISGPQTDISIPTARIDLDLSAVQAGVVGVGAGTYHSCALMTGGTVKCWGGNAAGQLGNGTTTESGVPVDVVGIVGATSLHVGGTHSCAVVDGALKCWGYNGTWGGGGHGVLGNNSVIDSAIPVDPVGMAAGVSWAGASGRHTCAVILGAVRCWGSNSRGQLGVGFSGVKPALVPTDVVGLTAGATHVALTTERTCAVVSGGAYCWGYPGMSNLLGNSAAKSPQNVPLQVTGLPPGSGVTKIALGASHTCAVVAGDVKCWGYNGNGELGTGNTNDTVTPVNVEWP